MYVYVIDRYEEKYSSLRREEPASQPKLANKEEWGSFFLSFYDRMKSYEDYRLDIKNEKYGLYEILYFLQRFVSLYTLVGEKGWENFTEAVASGEQIVSDSFAVTLGNYCELARDMQAKAEALRRSLS